MADDIGTERSHRLTCEECSVESDLRAVGCEGHLALEDDGATSVAFFCQECVDELSRDAS